MVGSSKILTVSYGTFSCTLEGFEDSFETMKAIAEYFRDLAADDRYFGAEPPTPDAEMLARIAEREIARRVEARLDTSGVVLRAGAALTAARGAAEAAVAPAPMPPAMLAPAAERPAAMPPSAMPPSAMAPAAVAPAAMPPAATRPPVPAAAWSAPAPVAAEDSAQPAAAASAGARPAEATAPAPSAAEPFGTAPAAGAPPRVAAPHMFDLDAAYAPPASSAAPAPSPVVPLVGPVPPRVSTVPPHPDANSVAAKLQRIRAVVGTAMPVTAPSIAGEDPDAAEDTYLHGDFADPDAIRGPALSDDWDADAPAPADAAAAEAAEAAAAPAPAARPEDDEPAEDIAAAEDIADLARLDAADAAEGPAGPEPDAEAAAAPAPSRAPRVIRLSRDAFERALAEGRIERQPSRPAEAAAFPAAVPPAGREAEEDGDDAEAFDAAGDAAPGPAAGPSPALSAEAEAELLAELAALELGETAPPPAPEAEGGEPPAADFDAESLRAALAAADSAAAPQESEASPRADRDIDAIAALIDAGDAHNDIAPPEAAPVRGTPAPGTADEEAVLARLLDGTDARLADPEAERRRDAISQLKAAVAATRADRALGEPARMPAQRPDADVAAFRDDLRQIVRPRRPGAAGAAPRAERPRPAPLKLVASQRIDLPRVAEAEESLHPAPVRPRRVRREEGGAEPSQSFADFAASMGATSLSDLLEAAAAYTSFVEGVPDFSRPQVMKIVGSLAGSDRFTREDTLRSFGTLLREGRILRAGMGRFQVPEETRFNPARRAG